MKHLKKFFFCLAGCSFLAPGPLYGDNQGKYQAGRMVSLHPEQAEPPDGTRAPLLEQLSDGSWSWTLRADENSSQLLFDLDKLNLNPNAYDEIHFAFLNRNSLVMLAVELLDYPEVDMRRNWYSKISLPENKWLDWRLDLHLDDDGMAPGPQQFDGRKLKVTLHKRYLRQQGELATRQIIFTDITFVRRPVSLQFDIFQAEYQKKQDSDGKPVYQWLYQLELCNQESRENRVELYSNAGDLRHFRADWQKQDLTLGPRERRRIPLLLTLPVASAEKLPILFSERLLPTMRLPDHPELPELHPLLGYRPKYLYATVAPTAVRQKRPEFEAAEREQLLQEARADLQRNFAIPEHGIPLHPQQYYDKETNSSLSAISWFRHRSQKSGNLFTFDPHINAAYIGSIHNLNFERLLLLGKAYSLTQEAAFAEAARDRFLQYARSYTSLHRAGSSASTGFQTRLGSSTLMTSYYFYKATDAYAYIRESPFLNSDDRKEIESGFLVPEISGLYSHNIEFTNMQVEHFRTYSRAAAGMNRHWNLLGEALYGDHGYYQIIENSFSDDGFSHEGAAYHRSIMGPLMQFAAQMREMGMEVMNERFKRVFDGYVYNSPDGICTEPQQLAELKIAYQVYRDPLYLPSLRQAALTTDEGGTPLLNSTLAPNRGFIWLREKSDAGFRALSLNYLMIRDRGERDRLHFNLYDPQPLNGEMGRIIYSSPQAKLMEQTFSHNAITIDQQDQADLPAQLAAFLSRPSLPAALITEKSEAEIYPGMRFSRAVAICDGIFLVADIFQSRDTSVHTFDAPFYSFWQPGYQHDNGAILPFAVEADTREVGYPLLQELHSMPADDGYQFLTGIPAWDSGSRRFLFRKPSSRYLRITGLGQPGSTLFSASIPRGYRPQPGPVVFLRQRGSEAVFASAFEIVANPDAPGRVRKISFQGMAPDQAPCSGTWRLETDSADYLLTVKRHQNGQGAAQKLDNSILQLEKVNVNR